MSAAFKDPVRSFFSFWYRAQFGLFSKHRPSGPMLSISRNVRLCVCPSVCPCVCSLLRYRLNVFLPPLNKVGCPVFLEFRNPWGKVMERSGLRLEYFVWTFLSFCVFGDFFHFSKKSGFGVFLVHPETTLPDGLETSG